MKIASTPAPLGACPSGVGKRCKKVQKRAKVGLNISNREVKNVFETMFSHVKRRIFQGRRARNHKIA